MRIAKIITLTDEERIALKKWSRGRSTPARLVLRAQIVLAASAGQRWAFRSRAARRPRHLLNRRR